MDLSVSATLGSGQTIELPGRGTTWFRDLPGPSPDAPVILLLHGWMVAADSNWSGTYDVLQQSHRVLAMDHRGHGRGIRSSKPFTLEDCADDAAALCHALAVEQVVACGYSMGGPVAQLLWRRHPQLVAGLILCATGHRFNSGTADTRLIATAFQLAGMAARLATPLLHNPIAERLLDADAALPPRLARLSRQVRRNDPAAILQAGAALATFDSQPWIGGVDVPTSVIVTTKDMTVAVEYQRHLAAAIPGAHIVEIDGSHLVIIEKPEAFLPALVRAITAVG